jgi:hypothetical protein
VKVYNYKNTGEYTQAQIVSNLEKPDCIWVTAGEIKKICRWLLKNCPKLRLGICHGVRTGFEVSEFRKNLPGVEVVGTDISPTVKNHKHCVQADFHDLPAKWEGGVDFIYSNALDHSNRPHFCLDQWARTLVNDGILVLHWSKEHFHESGSFGARDCFAASFVEIEKMLRARCKIDHVMEYSERGSTNRCYFVRKDAA